jgi:hypothetical protein
MAVYVDNMRRKGARRSGRTQTAPAHGLRDRRLQHKDDGMTDRVDSASDARTANNAVRHAYRVLSEDEKAQMVDLKDLGAAFIAKCKEIGHSRELSLAVTNAEQAVMWAVKHVTA